MSQHTPHHNSILERNLMALRIGSPLTAAAVAQVQPRADVEFAQADDGAWSASIGVGSEARQLASRRRPGDEGEKLAATVPIETTGGVVVLGFGVGHHVRAVVERVKNAGVVYVFEPDLSLLRAVLERVDHTAWLARMNVRVLSDSDDQGAMAAAVSGLEGVLALGVRFLDHPPSRARLGESAVRFTAQFTSVMRAVRTNVVTTLVQMEASIRNILMNLDHYSSCDGIAELKNAAKGRAAVVVSAGPSLKRNIDLLARPGVRDQVVIIAAQTVLKPLLAKGIRPHFVTALDYHEISRRFYEGLTAEDVEGVTLVAEPKANPAILGAFPGKIRCVSEPVLDVVLGERLARPMGELKPGATVAHLAYYLARHLGCDPVILIGQDLGFTDGQYYSAGAAIHQVWSSELNPFRTLEMFEWERIVRSRSMLRKVTDTLGRAVYTDEQMATYLVQFEREFAADARAGLAIIDATEGGVSKRHTTVMTLAEALERHAGGVREGGQDTGGTLAPQFMSIPSTAPRREAVVDRVGQVRADVWRIAELSRRTQGLLERMLACHDDQARVNRLIHEVYELRDAAVKLDGAYWLVHHLNQTGTLKRFRADRAIDLEETLPALEQQRRRIGRDIDNVRWLADSADQMGRLLEDAQRALAGGPKTYREPAPETGLREEPAEGHGDATVARAEAGSGRAGGRVAAVITVDASRGGAGTVRDLGAAVFDGENALRLTLRRLSKCAALDEVVLLTDEPERTRELVGARDGGGKGAERDCVAGLTGATSLPGVTSSAGFTGMTFAGLRITIKPVELAESRARARAVATARAFAPACWRGAIGNLSVYDEACDPAVVAPVLRELGLDAAVIVGADWALVDPAAVDECLARHRERPSANALTFSQATPGLGACLLSRALLEELAAARRGAGAFATIGGLLGYIPVAPQADPIVKSACVAVAPIVRDLGARCIADRAAGRARVNAVMKMLGPDAAGAEAVARARAQLDDRERAGPGHVVLELTTRRAGHATTNAWTADFALLERALRAARGDREDVALTIGDRGDPLLHPRRREAVARAREAGFAAVHVRTDLAGDGHDAAALIAAGVDVVSIDLRACDAGTYRELTGLDAFEQAVANVRTLLSLRESAGGLPVPWVVPRITRCDRVYEQVEAFYDRWLMEAGACVIDPLPVFGSGAASTSGARIAPLPWPAGAAARREADMVMITADGELRSIGGPKIGTGVIELNHGQAAVRAA